MSARGPVDTRPVGRAERVAWRRAGARGPAVAIALQTSHLGPAVAGITHMAIGDSAQAIAASTQRAALVTLAAASSGAAVGGAAVMVLGPLDDRAPAAVAEMIDTFAGDVWLVPALGDSRDLAVEVARHTPYHADPGMDAAADGVVTAAADGWREATGSDDLKGVAVTVVGVDRALAAAVQMQADARGALTRVAPWTPQLPATDIVIAVDAIGRRADDTRDVQCRVLVGSMGGPLDDQDVWRSVVARGIVCVPGGVTVGPVIRDAAAIIAARAPSSTPSTEE